MNDDDNEEKFYGILTNLIRKLTDLFFIVIGEKASTNLPLNNMYHILKVQNWHVYMDPCTYILITTPLILIKNKTYLRQTLTKT